MTARKKTHPDWVRPAERPIVTIRPSNYEPSKAELEEDISVDVTPEELAEAATMPVEVITER